MTDIPRGQGGDGSVPTCCYINRTVTRCPTGTWTDDVYCARVADYVLLGKRPSDIAFACARHLDDVHKPDEEVILNAGE